MSEPGSTGTDWRLHYSLTLSNLQGDFFEITDVTGGETGRRVPVSPGDVLLGDRIYGTPTGIAHVLRSQGEVIVRVNHNALPLFETAGMAFPVFRKFRGLRVGKAQQWQTFANHNGTPLRGRLIAVKRTAEATRACPKADRPESQSQADSDLTALLARRAILLCLDESAGSMRGRASSGSLSASLAGGTRFQKNEIDPRLWAPSEKRSGERSGLVAR